MPSNPDDTTRRGHRQGKPISLRPVSFEEAVADMLRIPPPPEKKRVSKARRKADSERGAKKMVLKRSWVYQIPNSVLKTWRCRGRSPLPGVRGRPTELARSA